MTHHDWALSPGTFWADTRTLVGGDPFRSVRLTERGAAFVRSAVRQGVKTQYGAAEEALLRRLARSNLLLAPLNPPGVTANVTLVIPAKTTAAAVQCVLDLAPGIPAIVVDDASSVALEGQLVHDADLTVLRNATSLGPAAARNLGAQRATTRYVAFCDADIDAVATQAPASTPADRGSRNGWIGALLANIGDAVAIGPRVVTSPGTGAAAAFERAVCALDMGTRPGYVSPTGVLSYLPSAALLVHRDRFLSLGGFDESLHTGEDVDFCWRAAEDGVYYEPRVVLHHRPRARLGDALARRATYGESAAALASAHPQFMRHGSFPLATVLPWLLAMAGRTRLAAAASLAHIAVAPRSMKQLPASAARRAALRGQWHSSRALSRMLVRPLLPVTGLVSLTHTGFRKRAALAYLLTNTIDASIRQHAPSHLPDSSGSARTGPTRTTQRGGATSSGVPARVGWQLLDDAAYTVGAWRGSLRSGRFGLLFPHVRLGKPGGSIRSTRFGILFPDRRHRRRHGTA
ncbi:glycosyltransferase [Cumulibacter soli]|uniref:glycosyltransferase n=1 Tax=Cumulibacter soli TaxID=2546344 RepID=UPI0010680F98|nr:glycosyltransferase [Cumulibacter soli]